MKKIGLLIVLLILNLQCKDPEQQAQEIYEKAKTMELEDDKILEALKLYDSLVEFKDTQVYAKVQHELLLKGYNIGSCLSSWTCKEMIRMENRVFELRDELKRFPNQNEVEKFNDAWGKPMDLVLNPKKNIDFYIYTPGPDGIDSTEDDLVLAYREKYEQEAAEAGKNKSELSIGLDDLAAYKGGDAAAELKGTLKELEKFNSTNPQFSEQKLSLEDIGEPKKQK
ncbi:hypothetical protein JW960_29265 [candidate division KSB1 bacterium]|nr:hypothetical protein [candidate division KSB1 bacterium]